MPEPLSLAKLEVASIAVGASALAANLASTPIPFPFLVFLGFSGFNTSFIILGFTPNQSHQLHFLTHRQ